MFVIGDLAWESFAIVLVIYAVTFWAPAEGLAQMFSASRTSSSASSRF